MSGNRPPFRVGQAVVVMLRAHAYWTNAQGARHYGSTPPPGSTQMVDYDTYVSLWGVNSEPMIILDAMVLTTPGVVGQSWEMGKPGYSVAFTTPEGVERALRVNKDNIYRVQDKPLLLAIADAQAVYQAHSQAQSAEIARISAQFKPALDAAQLAHKAAVAALRAATEPKPRVKKGATP
jgi:hypothetical protein